MEAAAVSAVVSMTLKVVGNKLAPLLIKEYSNIVGVKTHLHELKDQVEEINNWLEPRHEAMWNDPSFNWLKRLKDVAYDVDDVVDEFQLKAEKHEAATAGGLVSKHMFTKPKSFILECKVASKIKKIRKRFDAIVKQRADFNTLANSLPFGHPVHHMNKTAFEMQSLPVVDVASVLGRDQDKDKIITELVKSNVQQEVGIISVIGLGGSGKSTLAKLIFSDGETIKKHFELTLWVHVSQEFNVGKLIEKLFEAVTKEKSDKHTMQYISEEISNRLNGKKFLLVLDDVWTEEWIQWEQFMVHLKSGALGSKILLTTRSRRVAEAMESIYIFDLPFLSFDDSWQIFHHSFGTGATGLSPEFQEVGKEIVRKCGGVPLAIKSLAGVLRGIERRIEDWEAMRDNNLLNVQEEEDRVAACLRLSYSHLQYDLKQCFTICSVFPKGHKIDKEQLIDLWIAHDMISMDYIGNKHFNSLVQISFMQNVEEENGRVICRMHDLVHDLAQLILGDEISFVIPMEEENSTKNYRYFSLREQPEVIVPKNTFGKARAIYITKWYDHIFGMALQKAKHLRSVTVGFPYVTALTNAIFHINNLKYLSMSRLNCETLPDAISDVWSLQALHITNSLGLHRLPESIGKLKKLRTLNLSGCRYLNRLPDSIGDCHMISNIDLWHCKLLTVLPDSIGRNKELRVLRLGCTRFRRLPSIATLENLECLDLRMCHKLQELPKGIMNLKRLEVLNLEGCVELRSLLVSKGQVDQVQNINIFVVGHGKNSGPISEHANIDVEDLPCGHTYVMEPDDVYETWLKQKTNLQSLNLQWMAPDTAEVNNEFVKATLDDLEPPPGIQTLDIHGYSGRQYARWMQSQVGCEVQCLNPFPFLRVMNLSDFQNLKNLHGLVELPCLEELKLVSMPSLVSISGGPFPSLLKLKLCTLPYLQDVWIVAESTMPDGENGGGCYNFTPQLVQFRVGNCLIELEIRDCPKLVVKPQLPLSLQQLNLCGTEQLLQSPSIIGELRSLQGLTIEDCRSLTSLPQSMGQLTSLQFLDCSNIHILPESIGELRSLQELTIGYCDSLSNLPQSMGQLTSLKFLVIGWCDALHHLPDCLGELCSLQELAISDLPELTCLPQPICRLTTSLQQLYIINCPGIISLPEGMEGLVSLERLLISGCPGLTSLPQGMEGLISLKDLRVTNCPGIKSLPEGIKGLTALKTLRIKDCPDLQRRCKRETGEDWHLISHIPHVFICGLDRERGVTVLGRLGQLLHSTA